MPADAFRTTMLVRYHPASAAYTAPWALHVREALHGFGMCNFATTRYDYDTPLNFYSLAAENSISTATVLLRHRWDGGFWTESFENAGDNAAALSLAGSRGSW